MELTDSIQYLKGVGPALARKFERLEIRALEDLICHYPRRYVDFTQCHPVAYAPFGEDCVVRVRALPACPALPAGRRMGRRAVVGLPVRLWPVLPGSVLP